MSRVLTFSRVFPSYHPKAGQLTYFPEKIWKALYDMNLFYGIGEHEDRYNEVFPVRYDPLENIHNHLPKYHTIRAGKRWKAGDYFSPRVWLGKPYKSKMVTIAPDIEIKKVWDFYFENNKIFINKKFHCSIDNDLYLDLLANNDGLKDVDLLAWFKYPNPVKDHQIICWNENINY